MSLISCVSIKCHSKNDDYRTAVIFSSDFFYFQFHHTRDLGVLLRNFQCQCPFLPHVSHTALLSLAIACMCALFSFSAAKQKLILKIFLLLPPHRRLGSDYASLGCHKLRGKEIEKKFPMNDLTYLIDSRDVMCANTENVFLLCVLAYKSNHKFIFARPHTTTCVLEKSLERENHLERP